MLEGLTAKVFRTYKASNTLQKELRNIKESLNDLNSTEKKILYDNCNIKVASVLNHKKLSDNENAIIKYKTKIKEKKELLKNASENQKKKIQIELTNLEKNLKMAEENISLSTSKVNYMDPRITVAWCKTNNLKIEKIYNKTQLLKFNWAMQTPSTWIF